MGSACLDAVVLCISHAHKAPANHEPSTADAPPEEKLAASVAVGLVNRKLGSPSAVTLNSPNDWKWVNNIRFGAELKQRRWVKASVPDFLAYAISIGIHQIFNRLHKTQSH